MDTNLNWSDKKVKTKNWLGYFEINSLFRSTRFFFPTCHALIIWFELWRAKLYRNDLKGNKNYFELAGGSSNRGFAEGKVTVNVRRKSRGNRLWFELARGSSYRGFELSGVNCIWLPCIVLYCITSFASLVVQLAGSQRNQIKSRIPKIPFQWPVSRKSR